MVYLVIWDEIIDKFQRCKVDGIVCAGSGLVQQCYIYIIDGKFQRIERTPGRSVHGWLTVCEACVHQGQLSLAILP